MATGWTADERDFEEAAKLLFMEIMTIDVAYIAILFTQQEYDRLINQEAVNQFVVRLFLCVCVCVCV